MLVVGEGGKKRINLRFLGIVTVNNICYCRIRKTYGKIKYNWFGEMAKKITTVYFEDRQKEALESIATERGERVATVIRQAVDWYIGITPYMRDQLGELTSIYTELSPDAIIARLVADDERKRNNRNTKELGIQAIKQDTEKINDTTLSIQQELAELRALVIPKLERLMTLEAAMNSVCDCAPNYDEEGMEL